MIRGRSSGRKYRGSFNRTGRPFGDGAASAHGPLKVTLWGIRSGVGVLISGMGSSGRARGRTDMVSGSEATAWAPPTSSNPMTIGTNIRDLTMALPGWSPFSFTSGAPSIKACGRRGRSIGPSQVVHGAAVAKWVKPVSPLSADSSSWCSLAEEVRHRPS